jgi:3-dehydroquinate synthase
LGLVDEAFVSRFTALIERAGLPIVGPKLGADVYLHHMRVDKKAEAGEIKFVLIDKPGTAIVRGAPDALVAQVIDGCCEK